MPLLYTAEDAEKLVEAAIRLSFPPGTVPSIGASDYLKQANDALLTKVQIETKEALENVEAIAAVPGVDVIFVGPFGLGNNIGHPIIDGKMHDNLHTAIDKIFMAAKAACKKTGIFCISGE